jgi:hypothetical protein
VSTADGPSSPLLWTASAGGNYVEWFSPQLQAFTLGGAVLVRFHGYESNLAANVTPRAELAVCASDGTSPTVWGVGSTSFELGTGTTTYTEFLIAGDNVSVTDGQRLRLRFYADNLNDDNMVSGYTATLGYAQTTSPDTFLTLPVALAEYSSGTNNSVTHVAPNFAIAAGAHTQKHDNKVAHVAPNFALAAGTHTTKHENKVAHVAATMALAAGTHTATKSKVVTHVAPNFALAAGTHTTTTDYRRSHVAPNVALAAGTHLASAGRTVVHVAPNFAILAGSHAQRLDWVEAHVAPNFIISAGTHATKTDYVRAHVAPNLAIAAGTHTAEKQVGQQNFTVTHVAPNFVLAAGTHLSVASRIVTHVAPTIMMAAGTHTTSKGQFVAHTAPVVALAAGTHLASAGRVVTHVGPNLAMLAGTHTASKQGNYTVTHTAPNFVLAAGTHVAKKVKVMRPDSDLLSGGWTTHTGATTGLWEQVDEVYANDADFIRSEPGPTSDIVRLSMTDATDPNVSTGHILRYRYGKQDNDGQVDLIVRLKQGASTIASWTHTDIPFTPVTAEQTLNGTETDNITDYTDIRLEFEASEV